MKKLSRDEMKKVMGGDSCASVNAYGEIYYNQTQAQAQAVGAGGRWCCAHCSTATWYRDPDQN